MKRNFKINIKIKGQLTVLISVVSVAIAIGGYWFYRYEVNKIYQSNEKSLAAINSLKAKQISDWFLDERNDIQLIANNPFLTEEAKNSLRSKSPADKTKLTTFLRQIKSEHDYEDVIIVSFDGKIEVATNEQIEVLDAAEQGIIENTKILKKAVPTKVFKSESNGKEKILISFISSIKDADNNVLGALIGRIDLNRTIYPAINRWPVPSQTAESFLFRVENDSIVYLNKLRHSANTALNLQIAVKKADLLASQAASGKLGSISGKDYRDKDVMGYASKIEGANGYIISKIDKSEILAKVPVGVKAIIGLVFLGFLVIVVSIIAIYNLRQKNIFKKLSENEKFLTSLFNSVNDVIFTVSMPDRKIRTANQAVSKILGYDVEEVIGRQTNFLYHSEEAYQDYSNILAQAKKENKPYARTELMFQKNDGTEVFCDVQTTFLNQEGADDLVISVLRDITEKKKTEERLMLLNIAVEASAVSVSITDAKGNINYVNPFFTKITGYSSEEVLGKTHQILSSGKHSKAFYKDFWNTLLSGNIWRGELHKKKKNGELYWEEAVISPIHSNNGAITNYVSVKADITETKKIREELIAAKEKAEESDKLKTAFINNISHEIRTPLNGILGFGQMLADSELSMAERTEMLGHVQNSANRLMDTVTDYMDMAMIFSDTMEVHEKEFALQPFFEEIIESTKKISAEKHIDLNTEILVESTDFSICSDPELLQKILDKLLDNALKFTQQGSISCGYRNKPGFIEFFVQDTGKGIAGDKLKLIFDMFSQENFYDTRGFEGSGLGLTIAMGLVKLLGGEINVTSQKGEGSNFTFTIPVIDPQKSGSTDVIRATETKHKEKPLILIAEDEKSNYEYMATVLRLKGYDYIHAVNGVEAVNYCRQNPEISIVLMDIKMPELNGIEATKQIRKFKPELPIIATTAYAQTGKEHEFFTAGCNEYIAKPIKKEKLLSLIRKYSE